MEENLTHAQLYADLVAAYRVEAQPEGSFTARQFADDTDLSSTAANRRLEELVDEGKLSYATCKSEKDSRARVRYYYFVNLQKNGY